MDAGILAQKEADLCGAREPDESNHLCGKEHRETEETIPTKH